MHGWTSVTNTEMKKFIVITIHTSFIKYPNAEVFYKKFELFHHVLFHNFGMSYNRFSLILKMYVCICVIKIRSNKIGLPKSKAMKIKKTKSQEQNSTRIRVIKYQDKKGITMISTFHGWNRHETGKKPRRRSNQKASHNIILD